MSKLRDLFTQYRQEKRSLPAFNIDSFEIYQAVELAVKETGLPCLVQLSPSEDNFVEAEKLLLLVRKANTEGLPIFLNFDHGHDVNRLLHLITLGFDMVHFDGSQTDYQTNLATTKFFITKAKAINPEIIIEAEFNQINLVNAEISPDSFTIPSQAAEFISATAADLLAVSIGNLHGVDTNSPERLNISLLGQIQSALPHTFFTLHGGSGIPLDQVRSAIDLGVVKININTDLRLTFFSSLRHQLALSHSEKVYDYLTPVISDLKQIIIAKLKSF